MKKKAYIDPLTDYLLHDPEHISAMGSLGRGALTSTGLVAGGGAGYGLNKLLQAITKTPGNSAVKLGLLGGGLLGGGLFGHSLGDKWLKRTDMERLEYKLNQLANKPTVVLDNLDVGITPSAQNVETKDPSKWKQVWENIKKKTGEVTEPVADKLSEWLG